MPEFYGVSSRRNILDRVRAILRADCEVRMSEHTDICLHPWMLIALDRDQSLGPAKLLLDGGSPLCLHLVPLFISLWRRMYVVSRIVAVGHLERLVGLNADHARMIPAPLLIQRDWIGRRRESELVDRTARHIDEHIRELAVGDLNIILHLIASRAGAIRILAHVDFLRSGRRTVKADFAGDRSFIALRGIRRLRGIAGLL